MYIVILLLILYHVITVLSIQSFSLSYSINEDTPIETNIGTVSNDLISQMKIKNSFHSVGFDINSMNYKLGKKSQYFHLTTNFGKLIIKSVIDIDILCKEKMQINTICRDNYMDIVENVNLWSDSKLVAVVKVTIQVKDVNDNQPRFEVSDFIKTVNEVNHRAGKKIYLPTANDNDISKKFSQIEYGLMNDDNDFKLLVGKDDKPYLKVMKDLDAERKDKYNLQLEAWNMDIVHQKSYLSIKILVQDYNDNEPNFTKSPFRVTVPENTVYNSKIFQLTAHDPDRTSQLTYSLDSRADSELRLIFEVKRDGGVWIRDKDSKMIGLESKSALDYEARQNFLLPVAVSDGIYNAQGELEVIVSNVNDEPPEFQLNPARFKVRENNKPGLSIGQITIIDRDSPMVNGKIRCHEPTEVTGRQDVEFYLNNESADSRSRGRSIAGALPTTSAAIYHTYEVRTRRSYDRERDFSQTSISTSKNLNDKNIYLVARLICIDGYNTGNDYYAVTGSGKRQQTSTLTLSVLIEDVNDCYPLFEPKTYKASVKENKEAGFKCIQINAKDNDYGSNSKLEYTLLGSSDFRIDGVSGWISTTRSFDRERQQFYIVNVLARDMGVPALSSTAVVNITVEDENDNIPKLIGTTEFNLLENIVISKPEYLGTLNYEDKDSGENSRVSFKQVWPYDDSFILTPNGTLYYTKTFDREKQERYCISVRLRDSGAIKRLQSTGTICVRILDENDNNPSIISPRGLLPPDNIVGPTMTPVIPILISVFEEPGFVVTTVQATDADSGRNAQIKFTLEVPIGMPRLFHIHPESGILTIDKTLSQIDVGYHRVRIKVEDNGEPRRAVSHVLVIQIENRPKQSEEMSMESMDRNATLWSTGKNLVIVVVLSVVSVILIVILITAILCMLKPCTNTDPSNQSGSAYIYQEDNRLKEIPNVYEEDQLAGNPNMTLLTSYGNSELMTGQNYAHLHHHPQAQQQPQILMDNCVYTTHKNVISADCLDHSLYKQWLPYQTAQKPMMPPNMQPLKHTDESNLPDNSNTLPMSYSSIGSSVGNRSALVTSFGHPTISILERATTDMSGVNPIDIGDNLPVPGNSCYNSHNQPLIVSSLPRMLHDEQQSDSGRGNSDDDVTNLHNNNNNVVRGIAAATVSSKPHNLSWYFTVPNQTTTGPSSGVNSSGHISANDRNTCQNAISAASQHSEVQTDDCKNSNIPQTNDLGHLCDEINDLFFKKL